MKTDYLKLNTKGHREICFYDFIKCSLEKAYRKMNRSIEPTFLVEGTYYNIADYLALWGCDPCYDHPPRNKGDGYIFYNYGVECHKKVFLKTMLIPALLRQMDDMSMEDKDFECFLKIYGHIKKKLRTKGK